MPSGELEFHPCLQRGSENPCDGCADSHVCPTLTRVGFGLGFWVLVFFFSVRCFVIQRGGGRPSGLGAAVFVQGGGDGGGHGRAHK